MTNATIIQSLWIGATLSPVEQLCIASFLGQGHTFHLYVYAEVAGVPAGAILEDAAEIITPDRIFKYKHFSSYAGFANLFRYKLLLEKGGYWVDTDVICLRPFPQVDYLFATERVRGSRTGCKAANAILCAPAGAPILDYCYRTAAARRPDELKWGETGPALVTYAINRFAMHEYTASPMAFCPIDWWRWQDYLTPDPAQTSTLDYAYGAHLWHEMWRRNGVAKHDQFPYNCLFEQFKRTYRLS